jgi:hypothetical protein
MKRAKLLVAAIVLAPLLTGCSSIKSLTGQRDDSILPGERENVLTPDQQTARDPIVTGEQQSPDDLAAARQSCDPIVDPACTAPIDQESSVPDLQ